jgi:biopolymer transport protein ExbB
MSRSTLSQLRIVMWLLAVGTCLLFCADWSRSLRAQEADAAAAAPSDGQDAAGGTDESLGRIVLFGSSFGLIFYLALGVFSIAALAVTLERIVNLRRIKVMPPEFLTRLQQTIRPGQDTPENFRALCHSSCSPISNILRAGVLRAGRPLPEVEKAMEDAAAREMAAMRGRNRPLSVIGSVAPLVGLLGTVVGMIFAFRVSSQAGLGKAELLAEGIYLALMTTAAGLTIAIPCLLLVAWFNARVDRYMRDIDESLLETMPSFTEMENLKHTLAPVPANLRDEEPLVAGAGGQP